MEITKEKIICVHLLNDFSGSPRVFSQAINALLQDGADITLFTNASQGFLSNLQVNYCTIPYHWYAYKLMTLLKFMYAQCWLFIMILWTFRKEDATIYINTILPFGAALAGFVSGKRVVYHIHETSVKPKALKHLLFWVANITATDVIYVSDFLRQTEPLSQPKCHRVHNVVSNDFARKARTTEPLPRLDNFRVLMLCSLKAYKGVREYAALARALPDYHFSLVLNSEWDEICDFFQNDPIWPNNLIVYPVQSNVHPFFQKADLIVNLSDPKSWIETFGMTILEGMVYGLPAIVPPVGGVTELIDDNWNGYHIHPKNTKDLQMAIRRLATQTPLYRQFQANAQQKANEFSRVNFSQQLQEVILQSPNLRKNYQADNHRIFSKSILI